MTAPEVERRIADALAARTENVYGDPSSLRELQRRLPTRRLFPHGPMLAAAAAVVLIVAGATYLGATVRSAGRASPAATPGRVAGEGTGYRPTDHFVAVTADGRPVIVRADTGLVVRTLPKTLEGTVISPDGNRVYGWWSSPGPKQVDGVPVATEHVSYIDLADNSVIVVATKPGTVTGLSLSSDGGTIAYALLDPGAPERTTIFVHDLRRDRDWAYRLPVDRQVIPMSLSPDGSRLALTQTHTKDVLFIADVANPRAVVDADPVPAALAARPVPVLTCPRGMYDNPQWTGVGLFAVRQCPKAARTEFSVVRLDPDTGRELAVVSTLPTEGVTAMLVLTHAGRPGFLVEGGAAGVQPAVYVLDPGSGTVPRRLRGLNGLSGP